MQGKPNSTKVHSIQMRLMNNLHQLDWHLFREHVEYVVKIKYLKKKKKQIKKYKQLIDIKNNAKHKKQLFKRIEPIDNFVHNLSNTVFATDELELLNKGLNFGIQPTKQQAIKDVLVDFETAISKIEDDDLKTCMKKEALEMIKNNNISNLTKEMVAFRKTAEK